MRKMGYVTLQRAIERRLKANNKVREALGMELKEPLVADAFLHGHPSSPLFI